MNIIVGTLIEEKKRNMEMQESYIIEISKLPRGSISVKKIGKKDYCYLKYRDGDKFISKYVGNCEQKLDDLKRQVEKRKYFEKLLKELKAEYKIISKIVRD